MPTRPPTPLLLALGTLALAACQPRPTRDFAVELRTDPSPPRVGGTRLDLTLPGVPAGAAVSVEGNMTHAGMAPVRAEAERVGDGRYVVRDLDLNMAGDWVLTVTARGAGGQTRQSDVPLTVEAP